MARRKGKPSPKKKQKKQRLTDYNRFQKGLKKYLNESKRDWRKHGKFSSVSSRLWRDVKGIPVREALRSIDDFYEDIFGVETYPDRKNDLDWVQSKSEGLYDEGWYTFRDDYYRKIIVNKHIKKGDRLFFIGQEGVISSRDISINDNEIENLHDDCKALFNKEPKPSPPPAIILSEFHIIKGHLVLFYEIPDDLSEYEGEIPDVDYFKPDPYKLFETEKSKEKERAAKEKKQKRKKRKTGKKKKTQDRKKETLSERQRKNLDIKKLQAKEKAEKAKTKRIKQQEKSKLKLLREAKKLGLKGKALERFLRLK